MKEINERMLRVQRFLRTQKLAGVLLTRVNSFSWITAGIADNRSEVGAASLLIMDDGKKPGGQ